MAAKVLQVMGAGAITAVGANAMQTVTSVWAGICRYAEGPFVGRRFLPYTMALVPDAFLPPLDPGLDASPGLTGRQARMLRLLHAALRDVAPARPDASASAPLFLALPEPRAGAPSPTDARFVGRLREQTKLAIDDRQCALYPQGAAGGYAAMRDAAQFLAAGPGRFALVAGVDSYCDSCLLGELDGDDRVLTDGVSDAFAPGEGAACVLLSVDQLPPGRTGPAAALWPAGMGQEPGHRAATEPCRGEGLSAALRQALAAPDLAPARTVFAGLNGESFGAREWGMAALRQGSRLDPAYRLEHPADCYGDVGAATAPLLVALAALGVSRGLWAGPALTWAASEGALRGAAAVSATPGA